MNRIHALLLIIMLTIAYPATSGCVDNSDTNQVVAASHLNSSPVSFTDTPVRYAAVNGVTLGYRDFGSGEPILMIPGFGSTMDNWNETFISILASKYHVYTYDHRGMGYSSDTNVTHTIPMYADDAAALISALGYDSMHIYGASMGSSTSQQLVIDHPECVKKLILDSNTYSIRLPETRNLFGIIEAAAGNSSLPIGIQEESGANLMWNGSYDDLSAIHNDVMLVVGTEDVLTPDKISVQMAGQINGSWLVRFKGLPHTGYHYAPVQYGECVLTFLGINQSPV
ncbi:MAG: alpha/beta hydrolase [Methanospirillum sp.]|uniref:alpha/beta fold hydrolase n=1 Tax=Methanospirillum sp. TaxID=45200 RepID=UPI0023732229|nr:alpha/beta hydrolase [Methanospirillum sp.]MDD1729449.1 alpha/beta hydrolase [Methanospirillum sp.]